MRGCLAWQEQGLSPPLSVVNATQEYRRDEDLLADFIEACCFLDPYAEISASRLYEVFSQWFEANVSKKGMSQKRFGKLMAKRFKRQKSGTYKYYGLGLISDEGFGT